MLTVKPVKRGNPVMPTAIPKHVAQRMPRLFHAFGRQMIDSVHANFRQQVAPDGKPWRKLQRATIRRKGHDRILIDTGQLMGSISVLRRTSGEVAVGPATPYGQKIGFFQQVTGIIMKVANGKTWRIKRPFLGFSKPRRDLERYRDQIKEALKWR